MTAELKEGPLTRDELLDVWRGAVDESYAEALDEAGDGYGLEVPGQAAEVWARVSRAIDTTTQAMFILPWSGQTDRPASGDRFAEVTLTFTRTKRLERPLVILAGGTFFVEEEATDAGDTGPVQVRTGRRFTLKTNLVFHPGEAGPFDVVAVAEKPGWGFNNPMPGALSTIPQVGFDFANNLATITSVPQTTPASDGPYSLVKMIAENQPDMPVPNHIGQQLLFVDGLNAGKIARMSFFVSPDPIHDHGSSVGLDLLLSLGSNTYSDSFIDGELVSFDNGAAPITGYGRVYGSRVTNGVKKLTVVMLNGAPDARVVGLASGAILGPTVDILYQDAFTAEAPSGGVGGATWRVLSWDRDLGLSVTNALSPEGGRLGTLDELGDERDIKRGADEDDESYRLRVAHAPDVVTPNAIRRALNRSFSSGWEFREVGSALLPGFFYDGTNEPPSTTPGRAACDAYDTDVIVYTGEMIGTKTFFFQEPAVVVSDGGDFSAKGYVGRLDNSDTELRFIRDGSIPGRLFVGDSYHVQGLYSGARFITYGGTVPNTAFDRRFRRLFDYADFRAFFLVVLARLGLGEFGFAYDSGGAYGLGCYDGFPSAVAKLYQRVRTALNQTRAGGVGMLLEQAAVKEKVTVLPSLAPTITLPLVPDNGPFAATTTFVLNGTNLQYITEIHFSGGCPDPTFVIISPTEIHVTTSSLDPIGLKDITLVGTMGSVTAVGAFTFT